MGQNKINRHIYSYIYIYIYFTFTFTFMHLADAFIQSDLQCIQVTVSTFYQLFLSAHIYSMNVWQKGFKGILM